MRFVLVFPRLKTLSGAEVLLLGFGRCLADRGHSVTLVTRRVSRRCLSQVDPRLDLRVPRGVGRLAGNHLLDSLADVLVSPLLLRLVPSRCDALVFISDPVLPAMWCYRRLIRERRPVGYYCLQPPRFAYDLLRETVAAHRPLSYLLPIVAGPYRWLDRVAARCCDRMYVLSADYGRWCAELYGMEPAEILCPGVDPGFADGARGDGVRLRHALDPAAPLILTVNKLIARKGLDVFLRAMRQVVDQEPAVRVLIVGDGPLLPRLRRLHSELALGDSVQFAGFVPDAELACYYAAADVHVFLERNVPFGLTVLEAAACSRPSVAVRGGGTRETMVDGETGFLVDAPPSPDEVAARVLWLVRHDEEREVMGLAAARHAKGFALPARAAAFADALERLGRRGENRKGPDS
jgi:glycosyltransferase involved in cell wall biosynthesis